MSGDKNPTQPSGETTPSAEAAAERMWREVCEYCKSLVPVPENDPRYVELKGEMCKLAGPPADPLLRPVDIACLVIHEKVHVLMRLFLRPGSLLDREPELNALEELGVLLTIHVNPDLLEAAGIRAELQAVRGTKSEAADILYFYRFWIINARNPAIQALERRLPQEHAWIQSMLRGEIAAPDRATRLAQVAINASRREMAPPGKTEAILRKAIELHEVYKPHALRDGDEMLHEKPLASAAALARALEEQVGFAQLVQLDDKKQFAVGYTQAKDALDATFGRWHKEKREPSAASLDEPICGHGGGEDDPACLSELVGSGGRSDVPCSTEIAEAREATAQAGLEGVLQDILDSIDGLSSKDTDAALAMAAEVVQLVNLLRSEPNPGVRAGILYAWSRGDAYRGAISPEAIGDAVGVAVKTVRRWEAEGRARLADAGLRAQRETKDR